MLAIIMPILYCRTLPPCNLTLSPCRSYFMPMFVIYSLGTLQFWPPSLHQILLGRFTGNHKFVLREVIVGTIPGREINNHAKRASKYRKKKKLTAANLSFCPNHLSTGICRHLAIFAGQFCNENLFKI